MTQLKRLLFVVASSVCFLFASAQEITVRGLVTGPDNEPLQGVSVTVKETTRSVLTDISGSYSIKTEKGKILVFTSVGFLSKEVTTGDNLTVNVSLATDARRLAEVIVTAFGIKKEKRGLGYSTQEIRGSEISQTQRENFFNAIQGRVAGATVITTSGAPGASSNIVLRGFNSLSGSNSPLIVLDGLPISNNTFNQANLASDLENRNNDYTNRAADINPDDIESVTVLKGPEATALYGIEAGSGAIIITTKRAKAGKLKVGYDNSFRISHVYRYPEVQKVYDNGFNGASISRGDRRLFGPRYTPGTKLYDNITNFFDVGFAQKHNITLEGGMGNTGFRGSVTARDESGIIPNTGMESVNTRLTMNNKPSKNLDITTNVALNYNKNDKALRGAGGFLQTLMLWPYDDDARNFLMPGGKRRYVLLPDAGGAQGPEFDNPYWVVNKNSSNDQTYRSFFNLAISYDPASWWNITARAGTDFYSQSGNVYYHPESNEFRTVGGRYEEYTEKYLSINGVFINTFKKNIGNFKNTLRIGVSNDQWTRQNFSTYGQHLRDSVTKSISVANTIVNSRLTGRDTLTQKRLQGVFGEFNINYNDIVYLNFTGRNDWTSTLPLTARSFFYPSVSLAFIFSDIITPNSKVLSFGKIRGSYAQTAKDIAPYGSQSWYTNAPVATNGYGWSYDFFNNNPLIKPEKQKTFEFGTELYFFENRIKIDATYYKTRNIGQIVRLVRLSYGTGFVLNTSNISDTENKGLEISLNTTPVQTKTFNWRLGFNFNHMVNKVTKIPDNIPEFYNSDTWLGNFRAGLTKGGTITQVTGQNYLLNTAGQLLIDPTNGYYIADPNFTKIGDRNPDFQLGITNSFKYKNVTLSFLFDIKKGGDILNANEIWMTANGLSKRTSDRETPIIIPGVLRDGLENTATPTVNTIQILPMFQSSFYTDRSFAVNFVEHDVNWLRLRDVTLKVSAGDNLLKRLNIFSAASAFFTATDVFIITNYSGVDPSAAGNSAATLGSGSFGIDFGSLSTPRGLNFGLQVQFANKK